MLSALERHPLRALALASLAVFSLMVLSSGCEVDQRYLSEAREGAERGGSGGRSASNPALGGEGGDSNADAGANEGNAEPRAGDSAGGRSNGEGGGSNVNGGVSNANGGAGAHVGGGAGVNGAGGAQGQGGAAGANGAGGAGGSAILVGCGDVDGDAIDDCAETLTTNSRFNTDLSKWTAESLLAESWDKRDADGQTSSGSMLITNNAPVDTASGSLMIGATQCLAVSGDTSYELASRVMVPSGQGSGRGGINVFFFDGDQCKGTFLLALTPGSTRQLDRWQVVRGQLESPHAARSMLVRLVAVKPFSQLKLDVLFDDVLVRRE